MGPAVFPPGVGIQVRPHPHIGLATLTYLFEGEIMHRDSLGYTQPIRPGAVNLMTAGSGIVHSERAGEDLDRTSRLNGIQTWMALPEDAQEQDPAFVHYPAGELPTLDVGRAAVTVVMGSAYGATSPVHQHSPTLYLELRVPAGETIELPGEYSERAVYVVEGEIEVGGERCGGYTMAVLGVGPGARLSARQDARLIVVGGEPLGPRRMWWNFVSTSMARIDQARDDWQAGRFTSVPGDDEFIPLPGS
jgi:redox-sensitive bicupin YhaK (pirin superfamily)